MRWCLVLVAVVAWGQSFSRKPGTVRQGETLQLHAPPGTASARLNGFTAPLFPDEAGGSFGLMPVKADQTPGRYPIEFLDASGKVVHAETVTVRDAHYRKQNVVLSPAVASLQSSPEERAAFQAFQKQISGVRYWREPLHLPVPGCLTSPYGVERLRNGVPTGNRHEGIDQRTPLGTPVRAVAAGIVRMSGQFTLRGGTVGIDHGQGLQSMYLHMSKVAVHDGQQLRAGDVVGYAGSTGRSTAPHLHWSLYASGQAVNPAQWVTLKACTVAARRPKRR